MIDLMIYAIYLTLYPLVLGSLLMLFLSPGILLIGCGWLMYQKLWAGR